MNVRTNAYAFCPLKYTHIFTVEYIHNIKLNMDIQFHRQDMFINKPQERNECIRKVKNYAGALKNNPKVTAVIM